MTGTGTQVDPYIVDNWSDFVTAVGTTNAYVELAENTVIDMDDVAPTGISSIININCLQIDGKGGEIRGLFLTNNAYFYFRKANGIMKNLTLSNIRRDGTSGSAFTYNASFTWQNCTISGSFGGASLFGGSYTIILESCALTAQLQNICFSSCGSNTVCPQIKDSAVRISGSPLLSGSNRQIILENSLITGKLPTEKFYRAVGSPIDCDVPDNTVVAVTYGNGFINSDKFGTGVTTTKCTQLTTEQLESSEYLFSIGYPIGF